MRVNTHWDSVETTCRGKSGRSPEKPRKPTNAPKRIKSLTYHPFFPSSRAGVIIYPRWVAFNLLTIDDASCMFAASRVNLLFLDPRTTTKNFICNQLMRTICILWNILLDYCVLITMQETFFRINHSREIQCSLSIMTDSKHSCGDHGHLVVEL